MSGSLEIDSDDFLDCSIMNALYAKSQRAKFHFPQEAEFKTEEDSRLLWRVAAPADKEIDDSDWEHSDDEAEILLLAGISIATKKNSSEFKRPSKSSWLKAKPKSRRLVARHNAVAFKKVEAKRAENPPNEDFFASILANLDVLYARLPDEKPAEVAPRVAFVTAPAFGEPPGELEVAAHMDRMKRLREDEQALGDEKRARLFIDKCKCA